MSIGKDYPIDEYEIEFNLDFALNIKSGEYHDRNRMPVHAF